MQSDTTAPPPLKWIWIAAIWGGIGLFDATQTIIVMHAEGMHHDWPNVFVLSFLSWLPWALATPWILQLGARHPLRLRRAGFVGALARHLALCVALGATSAVLLAGLEALLNPWTPMRPPPSFWSLLLDKIHGEMLTSLILYYCVLMGGYALTSRDRLARQYMESAHLAEQLAKAQLDALRHQVEPHFLFNALNAVTGLVREGRNDEAVETIARVSEFLRHLLQESGRQEVPLEEELRFATMYLGIQKVRFADRLRIEVDVAPELGNAIVPRLILQPLVENAVKHGISKRARAGAIAIGAVRRAGLLVLTVYNDGPLMAGDAAAVRAVDTPPAADGASIGLANVRNRLRGLHGAAASLSIGNVDTRGVLVSVAIPFRAA